MTDRKNRVPEDDNSFTEALLAQRTAIVMEPEHEHVLHVEALTAALGRAAQEGIVLELLQEMREPVLGEMGDSFRRSLTGEPPTLVTTMRLWW